MSAALDRQREMDITLQSQGDIVLASGIKSLPHAQIAQSQFEEVQWEKLIPIELLTAPDFALRGPNDICPPTGMEIAIIKSPAEAKAV